MSDSTKKASITVPKPKPKGTPTHADLDAISAAMAAKWAKNKKVIAILLFGCICSYLMFAVPTEGYSLATLYMFAYNGKVSGRHDGNVLMANGRGRAYATPALVRNTYTMTQRGIFSTLSAAFRGLTQAQILAWNNTSLQASNRLGQAITVKGKDLYVALNANLIDTGNATIANAPTFAAVTGIVDVNTLTMDASLGTMTFAFAASPTNLSVAHLLFATKPLSAGVSKPSKSEFRLIDVIPPLSTTPYDFAAAYIAKFGAITTKAGSKVFLQLYAVEKNTGQKVPSVGIGNVIVP